MFFEFNNDLAKIFKMSLSLLPLLLGATFVTMGTLLLTPQLSEDAHQLLVSWKIYLNYVKINANLILWLYELFSREKYLLKSFQELEATNVIDVHKLMQ